MYVIDLNIDTSNEIRMKINVNNDIGIRYSVLPKIKYNKALDLIKTLGFLHIKNEKIGETTIENYRRKNE